MYTEAAYALVILMLSPLLVILLGGVLLAIVHAATRVLRAFSRKHPRTGATT